MALLIKDGRLQNEPVDNAMCADLNRRGWGCRSCTDGYSWDNTYVKGKMFPSSSQHPDGKCLEQPEKRYVLSTKNIKKLSKRNLNETQ